jgi:hypothetical protein
MQIFDTCQTSFAETVAERLFEAERRLREATQRHERTPHGQRGGEQVRISPADARAILRALLPACLALGRTRKPTLRLHAQLASFHAASIDVRDPTHLPGAIAAALDLADALGQWIDEARWKQATATAGKAWRRPVTTERGEAPIIAVLRQSTDAKPEQRVNVSAPKCPRKVHQAAGQGTIMLPLPGGKTKADTATEPSRDSTPRRQAVA